MTAPTVGKCRFSSNIPCTIYALNWDRQSSLRMNCVEMYWLLEVCILKYRYIRALIYTVFGVCLVHIHAHSAGISSWVWHPQLSLASPAESGMTIILQKLYISPTEAICQGDEQYMQQTGCCIYGLSPWRMASVVWCIISVWWWSFQTQLEMPAECACMYTRHTRHTPNTAYISSWTYLYFMIYKLLAISISTDYEPSYCYYLKSHDLSYNLLHDLQKSLKNPKPCHHSNSHINNTKTQHHLYDPTMTSSEPTFNNIRWGNIPKLTHDNYDEWKDDMILILSAMKAYAIITAEDPELQPLNIDHDDNYDDWKANEAKAASTIRLFCSPEVRCIVKNIWNPHEMWNTLATSLDTAGSHISRQDIRRQFRACRPKEDEPLETYFTKLSNYRIQLDHTDDAVTDRDFGTQIFSSLPSQYAMVLMVLKHRMPLPTPKEAMHDLLEEETTASLTKELGDTSMGAALFTQHGSYRGRGPGRGGRGGRSGHSGHSGSSATRDSQESKCTYCKIDSHTTDACRKRKRGQEGGNNGWNDERICFQCGLPGHVKVDCVSYKRIQKWWKVNKATATAAHTTTRDCDPFWLTGCASAATAAASKWVIDSRASHHKCNNRSSFSTFKKLSLPIVIELGDNNSVTVTHYGFVDIIQGYQVEALHTLTFRLSLLLINQLDLGWHMTIFRNGKCSITSPSFCNLAGKLINGIYIIVPATAHLSTTENGKKGKRESSRVLIAEPTIEPIIAEPTIEPTIAEPTIEPIIADPTIEPTIADPTIEPTIADPTIEPTIESSRARIAAKTKSLIIIESRLWHQRLAHINHTAMKSLVSGYTHDDSMCTVCIQAKHKQKFIRVPVKCTTKPFELVHSDVCGPFSTPTLGDNRYYILFIDDYTKYTSVWLFPNKKAKTCTSAYQSFQAQVDSMGYEIRRFRCDNGWAEYDNKNSVAERMICTITEKAWAMMIDSQAPIQFWGEAVNTAVYLHQRSPNEGLNRNDHDGYKAPYETPYKMLHGFSKPRHNADSNEISYQASLHNLGRFGCYPSRLIPEVQRRQGKLSSRSKPCMMVGYTHDSKMLWRIWDPEFQRVKTQSEVVFDEERNAHMSCQHESNEIDMFGLPEDEEYVKETDIGDEPLKDSQPMQIGKRCKYHMHKAPDEDTENTHSRCLRREDQTAQGLAANAENIAHSLRLRSKDQTARRSAAAIKKSSRVPSTAPAPTIGSRVTRSQRKTSAEASRASAENPYTYVEAMKSPQQDHWKRAMEEESTLILLNNTFSTLSSREARQLRVKPIGSKWVYKTNHSSDGSTWYKAQLVIKGYEQADFGETYPPVGKLTTFQYLISHIGRYWWNMDHLDVVTAFLNPKIDDDDIYMTLPEGWPEGLNASKIIIRLRKALYGL